MNNPTIAIVLACAVTAGCASNSVAHTVWPQDPAMLTGYEEGGAPAAQSSTQGRANTNSMPWEFTVAGGGTNDEDFNVGNGQLNVGVGYYFNESLELVARQSATYSDDEGQGDDVWDFQSRVALDFNFPIGTIVPYVGGNVGYLYGNTNATNDTLAAGPEAGIKIYLQSAAFLQIGAEYEFFFETHESLSDAFETGQMFYNVGLGLRF